MNRLLWLILLIIWILFGTWCCFQKVCGSSGGAAGSECSVWEISDGSFTSKADGNVKYARSGDTVITSGDGVEDALDDVSNHLKNNTSRILTIVGYYHDNESNPSSLGDLGLSRATNLKQYLMDKGVSASQLKINSVEYNENCYNGDTLERGVRFMFGS